MAARCCGGNKTKMVVKACGLVTGYQKEVFRWRSVAIIGGQPHAPTQDDYCNGWFIPKNTWTQGIFGPYVGMNVISLIQTAS